MLNVYFLYVKLNHYPLEVLSLKVKLCKNNKAHSKIEKMLKEYDKDIEIKVKSCLGFCKTCKEKHTALIGDNFIKSSDKDKLFNKIVKALKEDNK